MVIQSFFKSDFGLRPLKVEVVLVPGVSQIQILGLADQVIKESSKRILSALRHQGFRLPPGKQALVNLQPHDLRKSSQGLDLAIALGILLESQQITDLPFILSELYCYGQLSLKGEVLAPKDLKLLNFEKFGRSVLTGKSTEAYRFPTLQVEELATLHETENIDPNPDCFRCQELSYKSDMKFPSSLARIMEVVALGEHPFLIAGPAGCGKTTMVEHLATLLNLPDEKHFLEAKKYWMFSGRDLVSRPIVQPHHTSTPLAMIGGGRPLRFGEISLAHGGALILDELLEFHPMVQSALREPMEKSKIHLARAGTRASFPAHSLVLATTNLCPCGNFQPGKTSKCRCSSLKLRHYIQRLTGPFLDRFALFYLFRKPKVDLPVSLNEMKRRVRQAHEFRLSDRQQHQVNQSVDLPELYQQVDSGLPIEFLPHSKSLRRRQSLLRVARSLADLDQSHSIKGEHLEEAQELTARDIYHLEQTLTESLSL